MQVKDKEQDVIIKLNMISNKVSKQAEIFKFESKIINVKENDYWGGNIFYTYQNGVKICIGVGFEKRADVILERVGLDILFETKWKSLGLFVTSRAVYDQIKMVCSEENIERLLNILIDLMNETDKLKPIYLDDKE